MCVAPSAWPATHSPSSRTSRRTASSGTSAAETVGTCCGITGPILPAGRARAAARPGRMGVMSAPPAPPVHEPAWQLSRSAIWLWVTEGVIGALVYGVVVAVGVLLVPASAGGPAPSLRWLLPVLVGVSAVVAVCIRPWVRYRVHRWEVTAETVHTLTGWLTRTWTLVPVARI